MENDKGHHISTILAGKRLKVEPNIIVIGVMEMPFPFPLPPWGYGTVRQFKQRSISEQSYTFTINPTVPCDSFPFGYPRALNVTEAWNISQS
jgi:hypothetical protein